MGESRSHRVDSASRGRRSCGRLAAPHSMRRWRAGAQGWNSRFSAGAPLHEAVDGLCDRLWEAGGPVQQLLARSLGRLRPRARGIGVADIFPLPSLRLDASSLKGVPRLMRSAAMGWSNWILTLLNVFT